MTKKIDKAAEKMYRHLEAIRELADRIDGHDKHTQEIIALCNKINWTVFDMRNTDED